MDASNQLPPAFYSKTQTKPDELKASSPTTTPQSSLPVLRSTVAKRFMRMLRAHDRVRVELLATHPTQPR